MPIKVPNNLPAIDILTKENVFVMTDTRAMTQDMRPLRILLLNLMPTKIATETQLTRLLGNTPIQIELELLQTATHKSKNVSEEHMITFYKTFKDIKNEYYDGMIITGAPIELLEFEEVDYWDELCEIMEWTKTHVHCTFHICWGAQAGLYYHYGIPKYKLPKKLSGVYKHTLTYKHGMLFRGFDDEFMVPHSRNTTILQEDVEKVPELQILSTSEEAGIFCIKSRNDRQIFVTGHSEYDADTLLNEYVRDVKAGINPEVPANYFPDDDDTKDPIVTWRSCANLIYSNWVNYFVYQSTPYDISQISNEDMAPVLKDKSDLTIAKFGGSSLSDAEQFKKVADIVKEDPARKVIVASAPGVNDEDQKITDMLIEGVTGEASLEETLDAVGERIAGIAKDLGIEFDIDSVIDEIKNGYKSIVGEGADPVDYVISRGEYMSAKLLSILLGYDFVDAKDLIVFGEDGELDADATRDRIAEVMKNHENAVVPGFFGASEDGRIHTFSRGGSDITGALIAEAMKADIYENWKDVPGFLLADPRIVKDPLSVPVIAYRELRELSLQGAKVMHEDAIAPVKHIGIPINIKSTFEPEKPGTMIVNNADFYNSPLDITGITGKTGLASILVEKEKLTKDASVSSLIDKIMENHGIEVLGEQIGIDSLSIIVKADAIRACEDEVTAEIRKAVEDAEVTVSGGLATIAIVGRNIPNTASVAVKIFEALSSDGINVRFVDHGAEQILVQVGVSEADYKKAIRSIYRAFTSL